MNVSSPSVSGFPVADAQLDKLEHQVFAFTRDLGADHVGCQSLCRAPELGSYPQRACYSASYTSLGEPEDLKALPVVVRLRILANNAEAIMQALAQVA
jgi:hypothetical protein